MPPSNQVPIILEKIMQIHKRKGEDYAQSNNPFSNFERAAIIASWFNDPVDKVFATLFGIKLARLAELKNGKLPHNESIEDSHLDFSTYSVLWYARYLELFDATIRINRGLEQTLDLRDSGYFKTDSNQNQATPDPARNFICPSCHNNIYKYGHPVKYSMLLKGQPKEDLYFCCEGCAKDFDAKLVKQAEEESRLKK